MPQTHVRWGLLLLFALGAQDPTCAQGGNSPPLWQLEPFDRIELADDSVHDIDPVRIPEKYTFKAAVKNPVVVADKPEFEITVREGEYIGIPGLPSSDKLRGEIRGGLFRIRRQADGLDYYVAGRSIRRIDYFEDLLLKEANRLIQARQFEEAFPYLQTVASRNPKWPGYFESCLRYHLQEAEQRALQSKWSRAFESAVEAFNLAVERADAAPVPQGSPAEIKTKLNQYAWSWFNSAWVLKDYELGRKIADRLEAIDPDSQTAVKIRGEYARLVEQTLRTLSGHWQARDMVAAYDNLEQAIALDPASPQVRSQAERFFSEYPVLRVAVAQLAQFDRGPGDWSPADWRCADLVHLPVLELASSEDAIPFESAVVSELEQSNINKRARLTLRDSIQWPDGKPVTAVDLLRLLVHSCRPESPLYHPGLSRIVRGLHPEYPNALLIDFQRPQFRPAAWLQMHMIRATGSEQSIRFSTADGLGPFRLLRSSPQRTIYVANPKFHESGHPRLQQIVETRYATSAQRLRALEKRQVDLVPFVPPTQAKKVEALEGVRLVRMGQPAVHVLQFNFDRELLNDRTLRRAIDYAIDREAVMRAIGVEPDEQNCVVTAPLPHGSFGYDVQIAPREPNPTLAKAVIMGLKKKHGSLPALTLTHTGNESTLEACRRIAQSLKDVGLNVTVVDRYDERGGGLRGDLRFESYIVREPLYHLITLLTRENPSLVDHTTPWLRQQLIELQNVPHFTAAKALLPSLHRTLHEDIAVLPLWQTYDWFAVSDAIAGVPESPETVYDDVHRWTVAPTFPPADWRTPQTPEASAQADAEPKSP